MGACAEAVQACDANGSWGECSVTPADADTCEAGNDANCNGTPNEDCLCIVGSTRSCAEDGALGACAAGLQRCEDGSAWTSCSVSAEEEDTCEAGNDANCNGTPNEECSCDDGDSQPCGTSDVGECQLGESLCVGGTWGECQYAVLPSARDCASTTDNDCNGRVDSDENDFCQCAPNSTRDCGNFDLALADVGICRAGTETCVAAESGARSSWGDCAEAIPPAARDCRSAQDNDCNGAADRSESAYCACAPAAVQDCGDFDLTLAGTGICVAGSQVCEASSDYQSSSWGECWGDIGPQTEVCDSGGVDEDCDGDSNEYPPCLDFTTIAAGTQGTCATATDGLARCWGLRLNGADTPREWQFDAVATLVPGDVGGFVEVDPGNRFACGRTAAGAVYCWGEATYLGDGTGFDSAIPQEIIAADVVSIGVGEGTTCAVIGNGTVLCWGTNVYCEAGQETTVDVSTPTLVPNLPPALSVAGGGYHTCSVVQDGSVYCFGSNLYQQLAQPDTLDHANPVRIMQLPVSTAVALGDTHSCALSEDGEVYCWGNNDFGQLGIGSTGGTLTSPNRAGTLANVVQLTAGGNRTCARTETGVAYCWGRYTYGGDGISDDILSTPTQIPGLSGVRSISAGTDHICAVLDDGSARCWGGADSSAKLGAGPGTTGWAPEPLVVLNESGTEAP